MAKVTRISFGMARTINLGGYENVRVEHSMEVEPDGSETSSQVYAVLVKMVGERIGELEKAARLQAEEDGRG